MDLMDVLGKFEDCFNEYAFYLHSSQENTADKTYELTRQMAIISMEYLLGIAKHCGFKDTFEAFYTPGPLKVSIKSTKTGSEYYFYHDWVNHKLVFGSYIDNPKYLKNMQDDFIVDFFSTCNKYIFKYVDSHHGTSGDSIFHASIKSNIFRLFRNYTYGIISNEDEERENINQILDLGYFEKEWKVDGTEPLNTLQLHKELSIAMKYFYKFNYCLWKARKNSKN